KLTRSPSPAALRFVEAAQQHRLEDRIADRDFGGLKRRACRIELRRGLWRAVARGEQNEESGERRVSGHPVQDTPAGYVRSGGLKYQPQNSASFSPTR